MGKYIHIPGPFWAVMNRLGKIAAFLAGLQVLGVFYSMPGSPSQKLSGTFHWMFGVNISSATADKPNPDVGPSVYFKQPVVLVAGNLSKDEAGGITKQLRDARIAAKMKLFQNSYIVYVDSGRNSRELRMILKRVHAKGFPNAYIVQK